MTAEQRSLLLEALRSRFAVVQIVRRSAEGVWEVSNTSRAHSGVAPLSNEGLRALDLALSWIAAPCRGQVAEALQGALEGSLDRTLRCEGDPTAAAKRWFEISVSRMPDEDGRAVCLLTARDVTQERLAVQQLAERSEHWALVSTATGLGSITYDIATRVVHLDESAAIHHGLGAPEREGVALDVWVGCLLAEDQAKAHALLTSLKEPGQTQALTVRVPGISAKQLKVLELAFRCTSDRSRLVGSSRDVTEERTVEEMRRKKLAAERANKAKSEFMSQVSHELRTPLNGILGFAQVMQLDQDYPLPDEQRKRAEVILYSGRRLLTLIDQLLDIARIEQGKRTMDIRSVNVASVIRRSIDHVRPLADKAGVSIEVVVARPDKDALRADPAALEQVLVNLLSNAIKYNKPQGRVRVRFESKVGAALIVDDTGRGMSDAEIARLFEPFNRLSAQNTEVQGHGLGLVITRQLVEAMAGELKVQSKPGVGSRFSVHLPLATQSRFDATQSLPLDLPSQWGPRRHTEVLYVEDEEINMLLMQQVFTTQPAWTLHTATTGSEGLRIAHQQSPDVILLDLNLPDMSGVEVFKLLRSDPRTRHIPCVAVSADAMPAQIRKALAEGFSDYWVKPLELTSVISKLKGFLSTSDV